MLTLLLLLGLAIATPEPAPVCVNCEAQRKCELYFAPSQIEGAGFGVYTAVDLSNGDYIGEPNQFIPVIDKFKTLPFRGQRLFLSWLGYIYPACLITRVVNIFEDYSWAFVVITCLFA
jgi:hypothetical protein